MINADEKIDLENKWKKNPENKRPKKEKDDGASDFEDEIKEYGDKDFAAGASGTKKPKTSKEPASFDPFFQVIGEDNGVEKRVVTRDGKVPRL
jgi:hypothetical protein